MKLSPPPFPDPEKTFRGFKNKILFVYFIFKIKMTKTVIVRHLRSSHLDWYRLKFLLLSQHTIFVC